MATFMFCGNKNYTPFFQKLSTSKANTCMLICQRLTALDISIPEIGGSPGGVQRLFPSFAVSFPSPDNPLPLSTMSKINVFSGARNVIVSGAVSVPETVREALSYADAAVSTQIGCTEVVAPTTATPVSTATTFLATTTLNADSAYLNAAAACHTDNAIGVLTVLIFDSFLIHF